MTEFAANVKKLRMSRNMTLEEFADAINKKYGTKYSKGTVSRWESGTDPTMDSVRNLAKFFGVTLDAILGIKLDENDVNPIDSYIPVLGSVAAGEPLYAEQDIIGYTACPPLFKAKSHELFYLRVRGDSMDKEFPEGSEVLVDQSASVKNGDIAVILVNGDEGTVKKVKFESDKIILIPMSNNAEHYATAYDLSDIHIVGKVIGVFKTY